VPAEIAGQRPLLERAAASDREAFAQLYDAQVEGVYRYLLAWTGNRQQAADLTSQVFHAALGWLPLTAARNEEVGAWLIALSRDAVAQRRGSPGADGSAGADESAGAGGSPGASGEDLRDPSAWVAALAEDGGPGAGDARTAVARLRDPEREVVVLRLLLGHSLAHTAHLSGLSQRAVLELQLAACLSVRKLTGGASADPDSAARTAASAEEFERRLGRWEIDLSGADPSLAAALVAADALRQAIPGSMVAPTADLVARLRQDLLTTGTPDPSPRPVPDRSGSPALPPDPMGDPPPPARAGAGLTHPVPGRGPRWGSVAQPGSGGVRSSTGSVVAALSRRPWAATGVATAGIIVVLALHAFGEPGKAPSPTSTTVAAVAAGGTSLGTPLTTLLEPSTTTSTTRPPLPLATSAPRATAPPAPPTTRPAATAPQTTRGPRPTTTQAPTTTAPTTTAATTTTTSAPAPT
jgi:DNA-directed RNA polymerase specialized sigma24 family protein